MIPGEWAIIGTREIKAALVQWGKPEGKFYWLGSVSWSVFNPDFDVVLEDLGTLDEAGFDRARLRTLAEYHDLEQMIPATAGVEGWLSPAGEFFACDYGQHDYLANVIVAHRYGTLEGVRRLETERWLRVYESGVIGNLQWAYGISPGQTDALVAMVLHPDSQSEAAEEIRSLLWSLLDGA